MLEELGHCDLSRIQGRMHEVAVEFDAARDEQTCQRLIKEYLALESEWDELTDPGHLHMRN